MARFSVKTTVTTGASANAFITVLGMKLANTTGHMAELRRCTIGGAAGAVQDVNVSIKFDRTGNTTDGTSTAVNVNTILQHEPLSVASNMNAIGRNYSAEPTTFDGDAGGGGSLNSRGTLVLEWPAGEGIKWGKNQLLALLAAPGAATATTLDVCLEWVE